MGVPSAGVRDLATTLASAALAALDAATTPALVHGPFNLTVSGTFVATIAAERSFDGGTTWVPVWADGGGVALIFTGPASHIMVEPESGVLWRLRASAFTSGSAAARVSQ
jgi:hypothetical protein